MEGTNEQITYGDHREAYTMDGYMAADEQTVVQQEQQPDINQILKAACQTLRAMRKYFSRLGGMYVLGTIVIYGVQIVFLLLGELFCPQLLQNGDIYLLFSMAPMYLIGMPVLIRLVKTIPAQKIERHRMKAGHFLVALIMCFGAMYLTNLIGNIITAIIGMLKEGSVQNELANVLESTSLWMIALVTVICAPVIEEYVFRKLIVERVIHYGEGTAILLSGLMFGLFHGNLNQFVYAFALGVFLAFLYAKTGNLKITIAIHMIVNFLGGLVPSILTRVFPMDGYLELLEEMDGPAMITYISENLSGILAYGVLVVFVVGCMIAGLVLFIVFLAKRRFILAQGKIRIPKGERCHTVFLNSGMLVYEIFWTIMIVYQLLL